MMTCSICGSIKSKNVTLYLPITHHPFNRELCMNCYQDICADLSELENIVRYKN